LKARKLERCHGFAVPLFISLGKLGPTNQSNFEKPNTSSKKKMAPLAWCCLYFCTTSLLSIFIFIFIFIFILKKATFLLFLAKKKRKKKKKIQDFTLHGKIEHKILDLFNFRHFKNIVYKSSNPLFLYFR
jgi:hypothetical protein